MPDVPIGTRPEITTPDGTEIIGVKHGGVWKRLTIANLLDAVDTSGLSLGDMAEEDTADWVPQAQPVETVTGTTYSIVAADLGKLKRFTNASAIALNVPIDATLTWPVGGYVDISAAGAGQITVASASGSSGNYLSLPGTSGSYVSTPNAASVQITSGDMEVVWREKSTDRTPASEKVPFAKWGNAGLRSYSFHWLTDGAAYFQFSTDGTATTGVIQSGAHVNLTDATWYWYRFRFTNSTRSWTVQYAADQPTEPSSWTTYSSSGTAAAATFNTGSTSPFECGSLGSGTYGYLAGDISEMHLRKSLGGANSWSLSPANWTTGTTWTSATGQTNTLNGSASITTSGVGGATIHPSGLTLKSRAQYSRLLLQKVAADNWDLMGDLAAS